MTYSAEVLADSPTFWWDHRLATGTVQPDRSGNAKLGTVVGSPTISLTDGITFDGTGNQSVQSVDDFGSTAYTAFSIETVFTLTSFGSGYGHLAGIIEPGLLYLVADVQVLAGSPVFDLTWTPPGVESTSNGPLPSPLATTGVQYHLVADFDGTTGQLYLDGVAYPNTTTFASSVTFPDAMAFRCGDDGLGGDALDGVMRHSIFYTHAIGAVRAAAHYAALSNDPTSGLSGTYTYTPRAIFDIPATDEKQQGLPFRLMRHYRTRPEGINVWRLTDGSFTTTQPQPTISREDAHHENESATYIDVFHGGHVYPSVSAVDAQALVDADLATVGVELVAN